jgi:hypothetical protein
MLRLAARIQPSISNALVRSSDWCRESMVLPGLLSSFMSSFQGVIVGAEHLCRLNFYVTVSASISVRARRRVFIDVIISSEFISEALCSKLEP